jgi:hypothetical protein
MGAAYWLAFQIEKCISDEGSFDVTVDEQEKVAAFAVLDEWLQSREAPDGRGLSTASSGANTEASTPGRETGGRGAWPGGLLERCDNGCGCLIASLACSPDLHPVIAARLPLQLEQPILAVVRDAEAPFELDRPRPEPEPRVSGELTPSGLGQRLPELV